MKTPDDPDFAGRIGPPKGFARGGWALVGGWAGVYALNLIVPLPLGWTMTDAAGRVGMVLAVLTMLATGGYACLGSRKAGVTLLVGGGILAVCQFFPFPQILAGMIGIAAARAMGLTTGGEGHGMEVVNSVLGGFVATTLTGGILIVAALSMGIILVGIRDSFTDATDVRSAAVKREA